MIISLPDTFCKSIAQKGVSYFPCLSLSSSLLNCLAAWRDLSEISLKFQYLHVQIELINFRRIILKTLFFLFVLSNVDIGINSNWLWSLPELHLKILTPVMHLTQALKEHVKDKGSQVLLWEIRNRKNPSVMSFYASVNMKLTGIKIPVNGCENSLERGE